MGATALIPLFNTYRWVGRKPIAEDIALATSVQLPHLLGLVSQAGHNVEDGEIVLSISSMPNEDWDLVMSWAERF